MLGRQIAVALLLPLALLALACGGGTSETLGQQKKAAVFHRMAEPRERAFTVLVPDGWSTEGGIFRVDPLRQGGPAQSVAAKVDFAVKKDAPGTVMIRWLPDMLYFDARNSPAGQMGLFPPGSNYMGMTVMPLLSAQQFLAQLPFRIRTRRQPMCRFWNRSRCASWPKNTPGACAS